MSVAFDYSVHYYRTFIYQNSVFLDGRAVVSVIGRMLSTAVRSHR